MLIVWQLAVLDVAFRNSCENVVFGASYANFSAIFSLLVCTLRE